MYYKLYGVRCVQRHDQKVLCYLFYLLFFFFAKPCIAATKLLHLLSYLLTAVQQDRQGMLYSVSINV